LERAKGKELAVQSERREEALHNIPVRNRSVPEGSLRHRRLAVGPERLVKLRPPVALIIEVKKRRLCNSQVVQGQSKQDELLAEREEVLARLKERPVLPAKDRLHKQVQVGVQAAKRTPRPAHLDRVLVRKRNIRSSSSAKRKLNNRRVGVVVRGACNNKLNSSNRSSYPRRKHLDNRQAGVVAEEARPVTRGNRGTSNNRLSSNNTLNSKRSLRNNRLSSKKSLSNNRVNSKKALSSSNCGSNNWLNSNNWLDSNNNAKRHSFSSSNNNSVARRLAQPQFRAGFDSTTAITAIGFPALSHKQR
jgi:hypothetical protein